MKKRSTKHGQEPALQSALSAKRPAKRPARQPQIRCPACGLYGALARFSRDHEVDARTGRGLGRPTRAETEDAQARGLGAAPGRGIAWSHRALTSAERAALVDALRRALVKLST